MRHWGANETRYWAFKNSKSMDGLDGMKRGVKTSKRDNILPIKKMVGPYATLTERKPRRFGPEILWRFAVISVVSFSLGVFVALTMIMETGLGSSSWD
jgi:hypothetical protein